MNLLPSFRGEGRKSLALFVVGDFKIRTQNMESAFGYNATDNLHRAQNNGFISSHLPRSDLDGDAENVD